MVKYQNVGCDEVNLMAIWRVIKRYRWLVLGTTFLFTGTAILALARIPDVWEATAVVKIGRIGPLGNIGGAVESPQTTKIRMKNNFFKASVLRSVNKTSSADNTLYVKSLSCRPLPNTNFIRLKLNAYSRAEARMLMNATIQHLISIHEKMMRPTIHLLTEYLAFVDHTINHARKASSSFRQTPQKKSLLLFDLLMQQQGHHMNSLEYTRFLLKNALSPTETYPTALEGNIEVSAQPIAPRRHLFMFLALSCGLLVGGLLAGIANTFHKRKTNMA